MERIIAGLLLTTLPKYCVVFIYQLPNVLFDSAEPVITDYIYHCLFHSESPYMSPSDPKIDPQIGVRLV
jgi:hypothetical protein